MCMHMDLQQVSSTDHNVQYFAFLQLFPGFAFAPYLNLPFIVYDTESLKIGSYKKLSVEEDSTGRGGKSRRRRSKKEITASIANLQDDIAMRQLDNVQGGKESGQTGPSAGGATTEQGGRTWRGSAKHVWFALKTYYTAPCNKFLFNLVSKSNCLNKIDIHI